MAFLNGLKCSLILKILNIQTLALAEGVIL